ESAKDVSEGGLAVTVAEAGFSAGVGAELKLESQGLPLECVLFGEDASRIVISCDAASASRIREIALRYGLQAQSIGVTKQDKLTVSVDGRTVIGAPVSQLKESWASALQKALHVDTPEQLVPQVLEKS
ncbi:MAG TPA: AIR synthase-related protein, partial [Terriglobales bacterium]